MPNKVLTPYERAAAASFLLGIDARYGAGKMTSYELASMLKVTPQTMTSNMLKHGKRLGIVYDEVKHRANVVKRLWTITPDSDEYQSTRVFARQSYYKFAHAAMRQWFPEASSANEAGGDDLPANITYDQLPDDVEFQCRHCEQFNCICEEN